MHLVACPACHLQFDVSGHDQEEIKCRCGATIPVEHHDPIDIEIRRCGSCGASVEPDSEQCGYCRSTVKRDADHLSLICPECYGRNAERSRFCTGCGVRFAPQSLESIEDDLTCPCCEEKLLARSVAGFPVHECGKCHGLWAPEESFDALVGRAVSAQEVSAGDGLGKGGSGKKKTPFQSRIVYRSCPVCSGMMQRKNFGIRSGVIVDWCGKHGTWLDADELEDIAAFIARGGLGRMGRDAEFDRVRETMKVERLQMKRRAEKKRSGAGFVTEDDQSFSLLELLKGVFD